ncbi:polysaccharide deacetylase family protein [soil metagenome]
MIVRNKRAAISRGLIGSGLLGLLERLARRPCLLVLCYHRIGDPEADPFYRPIFSATPENFRSQIQHLRDRFRVLRLDEVIEHVEIGRAIDEPCALITFDDGYRDNVDQAWPILSDLGVPATFFLPTAFLESPRLFWWDRVAFLIHQSTLETLSLKLPRPMSFPLRSMDRETVIFEVVHAILKEDRVKETTFLAHLEERTEVNGDESSFGRDLFMDFEAARKLSNSGMDIGSHSHTHPRLAQLDEESQRRELFESRAILERELGRQVEAIAYPFGGTDAFDSRTKQLSHSAGYRVGFAFLGGVNRPGRIDPMALKRINIGFADTPEMLRVRLVLCASTGSSFV